jgi:glycosyltransferase involved in cell wall biosynthesis
VDVSQDMYEGVALIPLSCPKNKFLEAILHTLHGVIRTRGVSPDVLHIHGIGPSLGVPLAKLLGLTVVVTNHGPDYNRAKWGGLAKLVLRLGERLGSCWADEIICISDSIAKDVREKYKRNPTVIPNGVNIPQLCETHGTLNQYGLAKEKYVLAVGRLVPEKGFHDLIEAFNVLQPVGWKLLIIGRADHEDSYSLCLRESAASNNNIILTGFLKGKPLDELYTHADLFVLPSYYEGLPIVLLEALSYGLNCVVSDIPANRNIPLQEERFFEPGNVEEIAARMEKFMKAPISEEEKAVYRFLIAEEYDWGSIAKKTKSVYDSVVVQPSRRSAE